MSGGHWHYQDTQFFYDNAEKMKKVLLALESCFIHLDLSESGDSSRETVEPKIYDILVKLGDDLFN